MSTTLLAMAANNRTHLQAPSNFPKIERSFYHEFNNIKPFFPDWTIERIPRSVNVKRIILNARQKYSKWLYKPYNTRGRQIILLH